MIKYLPSLLLVATFTGNLLSANAQDVAYLEPNAGNPVTPGYFADPTVIKVDDTYYIFATTDGVRLASGEPQVWVSKDFVNWFDQEIDIPTELTNVWAPDVLFINNRYYYFHGNCEAGCNIYGYESDTPMGPWTAINEGEALFTPNTIEGVPALDQHYFLDDDGSLYVYYGTWISSFAGLCWARVDTTDMITILESGTIPNSQLPEIFEAPYMIKRHGKYIMMYSSGDCQASSYRVQYAYADSPLGPFTYGENNPILESNTDGSVDGPGHHSILKEEENYYIVYHRHDNPHSTGGEFRQLCIDSLIFENDTTIRKVNPSHTGIGLLGENQIPYADQSFGANASASSRYHLVDGVNDYVYFPGYATDNNNGTIWRAGTNDLPQHLTLDLGADITIRRVMTQFEYATFYYQYKIEYSSDSSSWELFADNTDNRASGSPLIDDGDVTARYLRITITGTEKTGMFAAIWNIKVYSEIFPVPELNPEVSEEGPGVASTKSLLLELDAKTIIQGEITDEIPNTGSLGGTFSDHGNPVVDSVYKVRAISLDGSDYLIFSEKAPLSLSWNSAFTVSTWVYNKIVTNAETIVVWSKRTDNLMGEYAALMYGTNTAYGAAAHWGRLDMAYYNVPEQDRWHHIALTFDGMLEKIYVDSVLDNQSQRNLFIHPQCDIMIGYSGASNEYLRGSLASLRMYDKCFPEDSIGYLMRMDELDIDYDWEPIDALDENTSLEESVNIFYDRQNNNLIIQNEDAGNRIERVFIADLTGRVIRMRSQGFDGAETEIPAPETNLFIVTVMSKSVTFSKLIFKL